MTPRTPAGPPPLLVASMAIALGRWPATRLFSWIKGGARTAAATRRQPGARGSHTGYMRRPPRTSRSLSPAPRADPRSLSSGPRSLRGETSRCSIRRRVYSRRCASPVTRGAGRFGRGDEFTANPDRVLGRPDPARADRPAHPVRWRRHFPGMRPACRKSGAPQSPLSLGIPYHELSVTICTGISTGPETGAHAHVPAGRTMLGTSPSGEELRISRCPTASSLPKSHSARVPRPPPLSFMSFTRVTAPRYFSRLRCGSRRCLASQNCRNRRCIQVQR